MPFVPVKGIPQIESGLQSNVSITKGDCLVKDSSGYLTNASVATSIGIFGVAAETYDNSAGSAGGVSIKYHPAYPTAIWKATCASTTPAQTDEGEYVDLAAAGTVNVGASNYQQVVVRAYDSTDTSTVLVSFVENAFGGKAS